MRKPRAALILASALFGAACGHPRPTATDAARGAREFLDAVPFGQNVVHAELSAALRDSAARGVTNPMKEIGTTNPMVHRYGRGIVDGRGEPLRLTGVNLGGAYLWEAWIWGGDLQLLRLPANSETSIRKGLTDLLGAPAASDFATEIQDRYIAGEDFAAMASLGVNVVRVPLNHRLFDDARGFAIVDRLLGYAEQYKIYVVLDLHAAPGGQSNYFVADPGSTLLWASDSNKARTVALWRSIAERYATRTIIAGYDLLNEPDPPRGEDLIAIYRELAKAIREVDKQHMLIFEGSKFASDFSMFASLSSGPIDANSAYSFHMYTWFGEDPNKLVADHATVSRRDNLPIWCGEFGENQPTAVRASLEAMDGVTAPTNAAAGWAFWTWKKALGERYPALVGIKTTPAWASVIQWISAP